MPGAVFSMFLVRMQPGCTPAPPLPVVERFVFLIQGEVVGGYRNPGGPNSSFSLRPGKEEYAFFPAGIHHTFEAAGEGGEEVVLLIFEQVYRPHPEGDETGKKPKVVVGNVDAQATLDPGAPEVFGLRKLLPLAEEYDFNIHIMDFQPGQYLHCNEMHYNQHGMLVLEGQGIYRLRDDKWYHVRCVGSDSSAVPTRVHSLTRAHARADTHTRMHTTIARVWFSTSLSCCLFFFLHIFHRAGDAVYMAPYVPQWYAALEPGRTRYILYKDTYRDPLQSGSAGIVHHSVP